MLARRGNPRDMEVEAPLVPHFAQFRVEPGEPVALDDRATGETARTDGREEAWEEITELQGRIAELQERLYAEEERALLVVLQGIDAAGKDSSVKHTFRETNPQGCRVYSFKEPTSEESAHDFLWRYQRAYEDALNATSTPWAPWYVVPSDHKWFRNLVVAKVVAATLEAMDPRYPPPPEDEVERARSLGLDARASSSSRR